MPDQYRLKWYGVLAIGAAGAAASAFVLIFKSGEAFGWLALSFSLLCAGMAVHELWPSLIEGRRTEPDLVLQRYPGPVTLRTQSRKIVFLIFTAILFGGCLLWMALRSDMGAVELFFMWFGAIGCAAAVPVFLLILVRGSTLRLDANGFQIVHVRRTSVHRWADTTEFAVVDVGTPMVFFDQTTLAAGALAAFNQNMTGYSGALPDTYGMDAWSLASLLNEWRTRVLAVNPQPPSQSSPAL